jgi:hypothetical protein
MAHIRGVLQFILDRHKPYAAIVLDRYSTCLLGNGVSDQLLAAVVDPSLLGTHGNLLRMVFHPLGARRFIANWDEVARHLLGRAERELGTSEDEVAEALLAELRSFVGPSTPHEPHAFSPGDLLLPVHIRKDGIDLRLFSAIMTLGTPRDVTLQELRIETFFPADEASERSWRSLTSTP